MITTINNRLKKLWSNSNCLYLARNLSLRYYMPVLVCKLPLQPVMLGFGLGLKAKFWHWPSYQGLDLSLGFVRCDLVNVTGIKSILFNRWQHSLDRWLLLVTDRPHQYQRCQQRAAGHVWLVEWRKFWEWSTVEQLESWTPHSTAR